jgi:hypothetical protein
MQFILPDHFHVQKTVDCEYDDIGSALSRIFDPMMFDVELYPFETKAGTESLLGLPGLGILS